MHRFLDGLAHTFAWQHGSGLTAQLMQHRVAEFQFEPDFFIRLVRVVVVNPQSLGFGQVRQAANLAQR